MRFYIRPDHWGTDSPAWRPPGVKPACLVDSKRALCGVAMERIADIQRFEKTYRWVADHCGGDQLPAGSLLKPDHFDPGKASTRLDQIRDAPTGVSLLAARLGHV